MGDEWLREEMEEVAEKTSQIEYHLGMAEEHEERALRLPDSQMMQRIWHDTRANSHRLRALCLGNEIRNWPKR